MERNLWNERNMFLTLKINYFQLWFPSRSDLCTYATETEPLSIVFQGSDRLCKVVWTEYAVLWKTSLQIFKIVQYVSNESERSFPQHCILSSTTLHSRPLPLRKASWLLQYSLNNWNIFFLRNAREKVSNYCSIKGLPREKFVSLKVMKTLQCLKY